MNVHTIVGRLTREPELKTTGTGKNVCRFDVAVRRQYQKDQTDFFTVVAWNKTADFVTRYFHKGDFIAVSGREEKRKYTARDGQEREALELIAESVSFCGSKKEEPKPLVDESFTPAFDESDELPF